MGLWNILFNFATLNQIFPKMKNGIVGHLCALFVVAVWGTTFISSKVLLNDGLMPAEIFFFRFSMAYICLCLFSHDKLWADNWKDELALVGLGVLGGSLYFMTENQALIYSTASNVSILVSTTPLLTALLVAIFYKNERMNMIQVGGSLMAFVGVVLVVLNGQLILHLNPKGDLLALAASLTWAFYSLVMRRIMARYSSKFITRKVFGYGLLTILPYFALVHPIDHTFGQLLKPVVAGNLFYLGICASTGGYLVWNWVMKKLGTVKSTNYIYTQSLVAMLAAALILDERITPMAVIGAVVLISGMVIAQKNKKKLKTAVSQN